MTPEEIMAVLKNPSHRGDLRYLTLFLIAGKYDVSGLTALAKQEGVASQLGYLSEVAAIASERRGLCSKKLYELSRDLYTANGNWQFLDSTIPVFARRIISSGPKTDLNKKWRIWDTLGPDDIGDWISLYHIKNEHGPHQREIPQSSGYSIGY